MDLNPVTAVLIRERKEWWYRSVIPTVERLRLEDLKLSPD
jgi:hypothetical protein